MTWLGLGIGLGERVSHGLGPAGAPVVPHERVIRGDSCATREARGTSCA